MSCVRDGQYEGLYAFILGLYEKVLYVDGAAVRKLRKRQAVKLAGTTEKQDGHFYLKILPDCFELCCFPVIYSLYAFNFRKKEEETFNVSSSSRLGLW